MIKIGHGKFAAAENWDYPKNWVTQSSLTGAKICLFGTYQLSGLTYVKVNKID